ncbi:uncharacterized protein LOC142879488 [Nelusetta ayraudi]|uniref:uncharacterized protein LOC142879488 n=1 Tax=Nelusetta ayraudi TaxID=303726 RepID=UPI003F709F91
MSVEKPNFLTQPVVKNVFMFRNGDPYYQARRIVINQKRVSTFETLLREVTGGIQAPFGAVRNIYTPRGGHKVDCMESLKTGEQYVAAGREKFKKLDYQQIGSRRKKMMQTSPVQAKPLPQNRIIVSARFLKPIKEPCTIFVVANGDVLNPAMRLLIHQRILSQFERILEMITEKMGLKVLGGVRSLYTYEGTPVTDGSRLESGQLYVAVGRERFKKLPYSDLLFTKPRGTRRVNGMKAHSLPPIYRFSKQNGNSKPLINGSDSTDGDCKASPPRNKEHLSSIVREISQARLISLRKKRSGQSMTLSLSDNADLESKADDGHAEDKSPQDQPAEEKFAEGDPKAEEEPSEQAEDKREADAAPDSVTEENTLAKQEQEQGNNGEIEAGEEEKDEEQHDGKERETTECEQEEQPKGDEVKEEVADESKEEVKSEEQGSGSSNSDKTQSSAEKGDGTHSSSEAEKDEQDKNIGERKRDNEKSSEDQANDVGEEERQKEEEHSDDTGKTNETNENDSGSRDLGNSNQEGDVSAAKESGEEDKKVNGQVSGEDDEVASETESEEGEKNPAGHKEAPADGDKGTEDGQTEPLGGEKEN